MVDGAGGAELRIAHSTAIQILHSGIYFNPKWRNCDLKKYGVDAVIAAHNPTFMAECRQFQRF
ncbi:hypothetical protein [Janthinobacterium sp. PC23-8]|uniref:hypothetical protein n=1 Tax=Janthinobacterium sp. PC23-8 TaxID=2012679 RepID=UPI001140630E|nr:hypothetical protein [Janthinobacterium sp. PC23-8]